MSIELAKAAIVAEYERGNETEAMKAIAELFAMMGSDQQAAFFAEVHRACEAWQSQWPAGIQWLDVGKRLKDAGMKSPGAIVAASIAAPLFEHTLRYCDSPERYSNSVEIM